MLSHIYVYIHCWYRFTYIATFHLSKSFDLSTFDSIFHRSGPNSLGNYDVNEHLPLKKYIFEDIICSVAAFLIPGEIRWSTENSRAFVTMYLIMLLYIPVGTLCTCSETTSDKCLWIWIYAPYLSCNVLNQISKYVIHRWMHIDIYIYIYICVCVCMFVYVYIVYDQWCNMTCYGKFKKITTRNTDNIMHAGLILGLLPANERRCYFVTTSLIGWAQT